MACQIISPLISLPGELRNEIFELALTSNSPIVNPYFEPSIRPKHRQVPSFGTALIRSCRAVNNELDISPLYTQNTFIFTRVSHIHAFCKGLTREQLRWVSSITIDLREAADGPPADDGLKNSDIISNEWLHYLSCNHYAHAPGLWCASLSTLRSDLPDLEELVIDLSGWQSQFAGMRQGGWRYFQRLLNKVRDLKSLSLRGKCLDSSSWNPKPMPWSVGPWFSPAYTDDDFSLLELLGAGVREAGADEKKVFAWSVQNDIATLEVKISPATSGSLDWNNLGKHVPQSGVLDWTAFLEYSSTHKTNEVSKTG